MSEELNQYPIIINSDLPRYNRSYTIEEKYDSIEKAWPDEDIRKKYMFLMGSIDMIIVRLKEFHDCLFQDVLINDRNLRWAEDMIRRNIEEYHQLIDSLKKSEKCHLVDFPDIKK